MSYLADTSFLLAVFSRTDKNHRAARSFYVANQEPVLFPSPALTELSFHFRRMKGGAREVEGLRALFETDIEIIDLISTDRFRVVTILENYRDIRIDFVDACVMALAERLNITAILTYDRRDFGLYRPAHCEFFDLLP